MNENDTELMGAVRRVARPVVGRFDDFDPLIRRASDARLVLLGEATHGTAEFYRARADITRRLVAEEGFDAIAVEGDWPDSFRVHRFVTGRADDIDADAALSGYRRFPAWMWRNAEVLAFVEWLRDHNAGRPAGRPAVAFFGLDLYCLHASMNEVVRYLDAADPDEAQRARARYASFEHFGTDPHAYGFAAAGRADPCEQGVIRQLVELRRRATELSGRDGPQAEEDYFDAEQNARTALEAERYYRAMYRGRQSTWNLRDTHMADSLDRVVARLRRQGRSGKVVVWAHNSHLGDARATEMGWQGELNVGRLARERYGRDSLLVGFTTHSGSATAAHDWDEPPRRMRVRPALRGSWEDVFHHAGLGNFLLMTRDVSADGLKEARLERAIGVIYRPESERQSHYFEAVLADQFDAVIHFDRTAAVGPLDTDALFAADEVPETFPTGV